MMRSTMNDSNGSSFFQIEKIGIGESASVSAASRAAERDHPVLMRESG